MVGLQSNVCAKNEVKKNKQVLFDMLYVLDIVNKWNSLFPKLF